MAKVAWTEWATKQVDAVYEELYKGKPLPDKGYVQEWLRRRDRAAGVWAVRVAGGGESGPC